MTGSRNTIIKFGLFAVIMVLLTAFLFATFAQVRTGSTSGYSAIFNDASRLEKGDTVRVAGIRVGTVTRREVVGGPQGSGGLRRRQECCADHRHQGGHPLPQPGR